MTLFYWQCIWKWVGKEVNELMGGGWGEERGTMLNKWSNDKEFNITNQFQMIVHPKIIYPIIVYSPSCRSKLVCLSFFQ